MTPSTHPRPDLCGSGAVLLPRSYTYLSSGGSLCKVAPVLGREVGVSRREITVPECVRTVDTSQVGLEPRIIETFLFLWN